jgi:phosphoglycolate phosphatase-like HAD superfamily hydrolase
MDRGSRASVEDVVGGYLFQVRPFEGVRDTLLRLRQSKLRFALATDCQPSNTIGPFSKSTACWMPSLGARMRQRASLILG